MATLDLIDHPLSRQATKSLLSGYGHFIDQMNGFIAHKTFPQVLWLRGDLTIGQELLIHALACFLIQENENIDEKIDENIDENIWTKIARNGHPQVLRMPAAMSVQEAHSFQEKMAQNSVRIVLMANMHTLHRSVANLFLKTLEDPRPDLIFLISGRPVFKTLSSRALSWSLAPLSQSLWDEITQSMPFPKESLFFRLCQGGIGKALEILPLFGLLKQGWTSLHHNTFSLSWAKAMAQHLWAYRDLVDLWLHDKILYESSKRAPLNGLFFLRKDLLQTIDQALVYHQDPVLTIQSISARMSSFYIKHKNKNI